MPHECIQVKMSFVDVHTGLPCFRKLVMMMKHLNHQDIDTLTKDNLHESQPDVVRQTIVDVLGTVHTYDCYTVMIQRVFLVEHPEPELLMRELFQFVDLSSPTPDVRNSYYLQLSGNIINTIIQTLR